MYIADQPQFSEWPYQHNYNYANEMSSVRPNGQNWMIADYYKSNNLISTGAMVALVGFVLSGPASFVIVRVVQPQPTWISPSVFVEHYHIIQDTPYYFGFLLIGGMLMLSGGHLLSEAGNLDPVKRFQLLIALGLTIVFCALVSFNYICQISFVRNLAVNYKADHDVAIATFSMANPLSFCWANEMWSYAFLGISTWLTASYYADRNNLIRILMIANGVLSLACAVWTTLDTGWVMTTAGLVGYFLWNILMIFMMIVVYRENKSIQVSFT